MKRTVLYHANCYDGFGAAYAAWQRFGNEANYIPAQYHQPMPDVIGVDELYLLDFSYARETMELLRERVGRMIVIDHHKTAEAALTGFECDTKIFDMAHSGAWLTFNHMFPNVDPEDVPLLYDYLEDRDLWRFDLPHSREANAYIKSFPFNFDVWKQIEADLELQFDESCSQGEGILRYQTRVVEMICDQAFMHEIAEFDVPTVNSTAFWSEVGEELLDRYPDAPFVASYFDTANSRRIYSLRSRESFDCSAIAKLFGGGGHAKAAGFDIHIGHAPLQVPLDTPETKQ